MVDEPTHPAEVAAAISPNVLYDNREGRTTSYDVYRPSMPNGAAVLFVNSGGFISGQIVQYAAAGSSGYRLLAPHELTVRDEKPPIPLLEQFSFVGLLDAGFTVFDVRHRNHPPARLHEMVQDVHCAAAHIRRHADRHNVDPHRIGLWGASAGGYRALHLGLSVDSDPFAAIAAFYPAGYDLVADVDRFPELAAALPPLQMDPKELDGLSLRHLVHDDAPPALVIYGTDDMPAITDSCNALCAALRRSAGGVRCSAIPGTGHEFRSEGGYQPEHGRRAHREMIAWFQQHLGSAQRGGCHRGRVA